MNTLKPRQVQHLSNIGAHFPSQRLSNAISTKFYRSATVRIFSQISPQSVPTVTIPYTELKDQSADLSGKIEQGFGPNGLGILSISEGTTSDGVMARSSLNLENPFKALGKLILDVGFLLAYHCDCSSIEDGDSMSCGWHTDHGSPTGLTCGMFMRDAVELPSPDSSAGLYVKTRSGQVVYGEDEIAYQIGETTEILSRGRLCATPHCVQASKREAATGVERSTFALFMQPNWDEKLRFPKEVNIHGFMVPDESISFGDYTEKLLDKYYDLK